MSTELNDGMSANWKCVVFALQILPVTVLLDLPRAKLSSCPQGDSVEKGNILIGTKATCTCSVTRTGFPGSVQWFNSKDVPIGPPGSTVTLTIASKRSDINKNYICKAFSWTGAAGYDKVFTPSFLVPDPPMATLSSSCPVGKWVKDGYIRIGTSANCTCRMSSNDSLADEIQWFNSNGEELGPAGKVATLLIPTDLDDINKKYTCNVTTRSKQLQSSVILGPKLVGPIVNFKVNDTSSLVVEQGSHVTFSCEVESIFPAIVVLAGPGRGQIEEFHLSNLTCEDTGRYECRGDDGVELKTLDSEKFVFVYIRCALKVESNMLNFYFAPHKSVIVHFKISGYPGPTDYSMTIKQGSVWSELSNETYAVNYIEDEISFGMLTAEIGKKKTEEPTTYNLNVQNGVGKGVDIKFVVHTVKAQVRSSWMEIGLGVVAASCLVIIIVCCRRKRKSKALHSNSGMQDIELLPRSHRPLPPVPDPVDEPASHYDEISDISDVEYIEPITPPYLDPDDPLHPNSISPDKEQTIQKKLLDFVANKCKSQEYIDARDKS